MKLYQIFFLVIVLIMISGCIKDSPKITVEKDLELKLLQEKNIEVKIKNKENWIGSNLFSDFEISMENDENLLLGKVTFNKTNLSEGESMAFTLPITVKKAGEFEPKFTFKYKDDGKDKQELFTVPLTVKILDISLELDEESYFGRTKVKKERDHTFHIEIKNEEEAMYEYGKIKIKPSEQWITLTGLEGYKGKKEESVLIIPTDIPSSKKVPFKLKANPPATDAGFVLTLSLEYSVDGDEWAEIFSKDIEMHAK